MKLYKLLILISLAVVSNRLFGQYTLTSFKAAYTPLESGERLSPYTVWPGFMVSRYLPFDLHFFGVSGHHIEFDEWGIGILRPQDDNSDASLWPMSTGFSYPQDINREHSNNFSDPAGSLVCFKISGTEGERTLIVEWRNVKMQNSEFNDTINFQIWYYEADQSIEYRYGYMNIQTEQIYHPFGGPRVALGGKLANNSNLGYYLIGDSDNPQLVSNPGWPSPQLDTPPKDGQVYRFTPQSASGISASTHQKLHIYPNPTHDIISIEGAKLESVILIRDAIGRILFSSRILGDKQIINIAELQTGIYWLEIEGSTFKVIKE